MLVLVLVACDGGGVGGSGGRDQGGRGGGGAFSCFRCGTLECCAYVFGFVSAGRSSAVIPSIFVVTIGIEILLSLSFLLL